MSQDLRLVMAHLCKFPPKKRASSSIFVTPLETSRVSLMKRGKRGHIIEVGYTNHVRKDRVKIFNHGLSCGVCLQEGRCEKPTGVNRRLTMENFVNKSGVGCPRTLCRQHRVRMHHWNKYKHDWNKYKHN